MNNTISKQSDLSTPLCISQLQGHLSIVFESKKCAAVQIQQFWALNFAEMLLSRFQQKAKTSILIHFHRYFWEYIQKFLVDHEEVLDKLWQQNFDWDAMKTKL